MDNKGNIIFLLEKYNIPYWVEGKNVIEGHTINIACPFCGDHSNHLGIFINSLNYRCWRCPSEGDFGYLLAVLTNKSKQVCWEEIKSSGITFDCDSEIQIKNIFQEDPEVTSTDTNISLHEIKLPELFTPIEKIDNLLLQKYLKRRRLDKQTLINYGCGMCLAGKYMGRLIIPVYSDKKLVAFQAADLTGTSDVKYKADSIDSQVKKVFYRWDLIDKNLDWLVITEGVLDSWRLGWQSLCSFGVVLSSYQEKLLLSLKLKKLILCPDGDAYLSTLSYADQFRPFIPEVHVVEMPYYWESFDNQINEDPDSLGTERTWETILEQCGVY